MSSRFLLVSFTLIALVCLTPVAATAQAPAAPAQPETGAPVRTPWGDPDLQGIWNNVTATPFERPEELAGKLVLTEEEAAEFEQQIAERRAANESENEDAPEGARLGYSVRVWFETGHGLTENRTSLVVDPPEGRVPDLTPEAQQRAEERAAHRREHPADSWEDTGLFTRCLTRGLPGAMTPGFYNHNYQILQAPGYVAILVEMIHDARIIPLDDRPSLAPTIQQWMGDSRGRWEGETLVVETTNFSPKANYRQSGENLRLVERFTRIDADRLDYQFTIDDPTTFTRPWTVSVPMTHVEGPLYEYACHEGNYGLPNILAGHRQEEAVAAPAR